MNSLQASELAMYAVNQLLNDKSGTRRIELQSTEWKAKAYFMGNMIRVDLLPVNRSIQLPGSSLSGPRTGLGERSEPIEQPVPTTERVPVPAGAVAESGDFHLGHHYGPAPTNAEIGLTRD